MRKLSIHIAIAIVLFGVSLLTLSLIQVSDADKAGGRRTIR